MNTATTTVRRTAAVIIALAIATGCAGTHEVSRPQAAIDLGPTRGERLAAALEQATEAQGRDVVAASEQWYESYDEAYETAQDFLTRKPTSHIEAALERQGLTMQVLNDYAAQNPEWVREQNALYQARFAHVRPHAFAIMGRIDAERATPELELEPVPVVPDATVRIAGSSR